jgi:hypothetical protein
MSLLLAFEYISAGGIDGRCMNREKRKNEEFKLWLRANRCTYGIIVILACLNPSLLSLTNSRLLGSKRLTAPWRRRSRYIVQLLGWVHHLYLTYIHCCMVSMNGWCHRLTSLVLEDMAQLCLQILVIMRVKGVEPLNESIVISLAFTAATLLFGVSKRLFLCYRKRVHLLRHKHIDIMSSIGSVASTNTINSSGSSSSNGNKEMMISDDDIEAGIGIDHDDMRSSKLDELPTSVISSVHARVLASGEATSAIHDVRVSVNTPAILSFNKPVATKQPSTTSLSPYGEDNDMIELRHYPAIPTQIAAPTRKPPPPPPRD